MGELDIDKRLWTIPRQRAKNDRAHLVHLSESALGIIESLPQIEVPRDEGDKPLTTARFAFTTTGLKPVSGFSHAKAAADRYMLERLRKKLAGEGREAEEAEIDDWILHDLRRTAATGMAGLSIPPHVVDKILNHVSGTIRGVAAVYNRHAYFEERKSALEAWGQHVKNLVRPTQ
jgi:integrase